MTSRELISIDNELSVSVETITYEHSVQMEFLYEELKQNNGIYFSSGVHIPDRYSRFEIGFSNPLLEITAKGKDVYITPNSQAGLKLCWYLKNRYQNQETLSAFKLHEISTSGLHFKVQADDRIYSEEHRSKKPSSFSVLRWLIEGFKGLDDGLMGLYGAFAYDCLFQFNPIKLKHQRAQTEKDFHLLMPHEVYLFDREKEKLTKKVYTFNFEQFDDCPEFKPAPIPEESYATCVSEADIRTSHSDEEYAALVNAARSEMALGNIYETVLHRRFYVDSNLDPFVASRIMRQENPSPFEFFCQFGNEQLVGTSPEMYITVRGRRVESCPISGTVRRSQDVMANAEAIKSLLNSDKDEVELTMCTDVDRNDKARICIPGSVKLLERRAIEAYAGLYHTIDRVEGTLREEMDGIDAFLSHMWAVTLMGSPKINASQIIEDLESESRRWYGGAVGALLCNGDITSGITIRTMHFHDRSVDYRVGATLVFDSDGMQEAEETITKSTTFRKTIARYSQFKAKPTHSDATTSVALAANIEVKPDLRILMIDYEDSFVNILADYFRQENCQVDTYRVGISMDEIFAHAPDLVIHSPGPKRPEDFNMPTCILKLAERGIPQFGVCLGLQGIVQAFGGALLLLPEPRQGKKWLVSHNDESIFHGLSNNFEVGAYHALYADEASFPDCLSVIGRSEGGHIMGLSHKELPIWGVQFHPESILSAKGNTGNKIIRAIISECKRLKV